MTRALLPGRTSVQSVPRSMRALAGLGCTGPAYTAPPWGYSTVPNGSCAISPVRASHAGSASGVAEYACAAVLPPPGMFNCAQAAATPQLFNPPSYCGPTGACCTPASPCAPVCAAGSAALPAQPGCWSTFSDWNKMLIIGGAALVLYLMMRK